MARLARAVVPGVPHHVTQRGNRRQRVFFGADDYRRHLALMAEWCGKERVSVWAYCLMGNHVHLLLVPRTEGGLARAVGEAHRRYTLAVNRRRGWTGYLWQGRFGSCALDRRYLLVAARYIELNPVRARLVARPQDWRWSSARAHLSGKDDALVRVKPLLELAGDWRAFLSEGLDGLDVELLEQHVRTGRPLGELGFVERLERRLGRRLWPQRRGPKPRRMRR